MTDSTIDIDYITKYLEREFKSRTLDVQRVEKADKHGQTQLYIKFTDTKWPKTISELRYYDIQPHPKFWLDLSGSLPVVQVIYNPHDVTTFMTTHFKNGSHDVMNALARLTDIAERIIDGKRAAYSTHSLQ